MPAWNLGTIWAPFTEKAPWKQRVKETPTTHKNVVFMRVFGVFLSLNGLLFILCEREKFYYFLYKNTLESHSSIRQHCLKNIFFASFCVKKTRNPSGLLAFLPWNSSKNLVFKVQGSFEYRILRFRQEIEPAIMLTHMAGFWCSMNLKYGFKTTAFLLRSG